MKKVLIIAFVISIGLASIWVITNKISNQSNITGPAAVEAKTTIDTVKNDVTNGGLLIDVRTPEEFKDGHIDGSINLPLQDIQAGKLPESAKDKVIYIYCRSGNRSAEATYLIKKSGYNQVVDLGAITSVQNMGGKIVK